MRLFFKQPNKKRLILTLILIGLVLAVLLIPQIGRAVAAKESTDLVSTTIANVVGAIVSLIVAALGFFSILVIKMIIVVASYNSFIQAPAVNLGWTLVRDICNMFFILILLIIAFSTALGYEKFHYSKTLAPLLVAAVLINFSKLICGLLIDFSQIIMLAFVSSFAGAGGANFTNLVGFTSFFEGGALGAQSTGLAWQATIGYVMAVILTLIFLVVLLAMLAILVVRIVTLWFLVVLSPFVFFAQAVPTAQRYASQWWEEFGKQLMVGPVMAIFIWISLSVVSGGAGQLTKDFGGTGAGVATLKEGPNAFTAVTAPADFLHYVIGIGMMMGTLMVAQQFGGAGAKIGGIVSKRATNLMAGVGRMGLAQMGRIPGFGVVPRGIKGGIEGVRSMIAGKPPKWLAERGFTEEGAKRVERRGAMDRAIRKKDYSKAGVLQTQLLYAKRKDLEEKQGYSLKDSSDKDVEQRLSSAKGEDKQIYLRELASRKKLSKEHIQEFIGEASGSERDFRLHSAKFLAEGAKDDFEKEAINFQVAVEKGNVPEANKVLDKLKNKAASLTDRQIGQEINKDDIVKKKDDKAFNTWLLALNKDQVEKLPNEFKKAIQDAQNDIAAGKRPVYEAVESLGDVQKFKTEFQQDIQKGQIKAVGDKMKDEWNSAQLEMAKGGEINKLGDNFFQKFLGEIKKVQDKKTKKMLEDRLEKWTVMYSSTQDSGDKEEILKYFGQNFSDLPSVPENEINHILKIGSQQSVNYLKEDTKNIRPEETNRKEVETIRREFTNLAQLYRSQIQAHGKKMDKKLLEAINQQFKSLRAMSEKAEKEGKIDDKDLKDFQNFLEDLSAPINYVS